MGRRILTGLFRNIRKLTEESAGTVPMCMKKVMAKAIAGFAIPAEARASVHSSVHNSTPISVIKAATPMNAEQPSS